jgi:hypothetical protein
MTTQRYVRQPSSTQKINSSLCECMQENSSVHAQWKTTPKQLNGTVYLLIVIMAWHSLHQAQTFLCLKYTIIERIITLECGSWYTTRHDTPLRTTQ